MLLCALLSVPWSEATAAAGVVMVDTGSAHSKEPVIDPVMARNAIGQGIDLTKANTKPGLRTISLDESWFVGARLETIKKQLAEQAKNGYYNASDEEVPDLSRAIAPSPVATNELDRVLEKRYSSMTAIRPKLHAEPISIHGTRLEASRFIEAATAGGWEDGVWTGLARYFEVPDLGLIKLEEIDFAASKASVSLIRELVTSDVNGRPAIAKTARTPNGRTLVSVAWMTDSMSYSLMLQPLRPDRIHENQNSLEALARRLGR